MTALDDFNLLIRYKISLFINPTTDFDENPGSLDIKKAYTNVRLIFW